MTLTGTISMSQSGPGNNGYEEVFHCPQSCRIGISLLDAICYHTPANPLLCGWVSYSSAKDATGEVSQSERLV